MQIDAYNTFAAGHVAGAVESRPAGTVRLVSACAGQGHDVAEALRGHGARTGQAWIPEADAASRAFYAHAGWAADGAVRALDTGAGTLREIRVSGPLDLHLH